jgi:branched-chain amino acid aminotransferase
VLVATTANVFMWRGGELWTPKRGMLPGVTRALVMEMARACGVRVRERAIALRELEGADEVFLTSSLVEILPVIAIGPSRIGTGTPGPKTQQLHHAFGGIRAGI